MIERACISLNHRCNLRCKYCHFTGKGANLSNELYEFLPDEAKKIVVNIIKYCKIHNINTFKLGIVGAGEPLLSFDALKRILKITKNFGEGRLKLYTVTNGVCLTERMLDEFYKYKDIIDLNFSLDGNEKLHNILRQQFNRTMDAIYMYEKKFGKKPVINTTVTRKTIENADELINFYCSNDFKKINFSKVFDIEDCEIAISQLEYEKFLDKCEINGIEMRQKRKGIENIYDCSKFGRICGVGHSNIFITKKGIYPCGRFFGMEEYCMDDCNADLDMVEKKFVNYKKISNGECYFELFVGREE